jgi:hypothetical protein
MKTKSHILLIIIVCLVTLITKLQAAPDHEAKPSANPFLESSNIFRIDVQRETWIDEALVGFWAAATDGFDPYDSEKMFAPDHNYPETYTLTTDNVIVAINGGSVLTNDTERIIPLGFRTHIAGTFTFTATTMISFDPSITVYLEDLQENILQDLRINNIYQFSSGITDNTTRFRLHYIKTANVAFSAGAILSAGQTICYNSDPSVIGSVTAACGGDGSVTYQWQSSTDAGFSSPVNINSNTATYDPPAGLTVDTWYRRQAKDGTATCFISSTGVWAVKVNPILPVSVYIAASPGTTVCPGTIVSYTATTTNGGAMPTYQWRKDGTNISGASNSTYTSSALANGNLITCILTSNAACVTGSPATSNTLTMTVAYLPVSVSIAASPGTTVCPGTSVTFSATPINGGTAPTYRWKKNGNNISGATNSTYTCIATSSYNGKTITCALTSNDICSPGSQATSNTLTMTVAYLPVSVSIAASPGTIVYAGTSVTFKATPTNGGTAPRYQWKINGGNISGATNSAYTCIITSNYNGKKITCVITSSETCISGSPATSNILTMKVKPLPKNPIIPEVSAELVSDNASLITRLSDVSIGDDISIYPNPATNNITLDYSGYKDNGNYELKIYSIEGKLMSNTNLNNKSTIINVDSYDAGIYYLKIQSRNGVLIRKFIKE